MALRRQVQLVGQQAKPGLARCWLTGRDHSSACRHGRVNDEQDHDKEMTENWRCMGCRWTPARQDKPGPAGEEPPRTPRPKWGAGRRTSPHCRWRVSIGANFSNRQPGHARSTDQRQYAGDGRRRRSRLQQFPT